MMSFCAQGLAWFPDAMVPDAEGHCQKCGGEWSPCDPVEAGWLECADDVLLTISTAKKVNVYHRRCADRYGLQNSKDIYMA